MTVLRIFLEREPELHQEALERALHFERVRIATWLRTKVRLGLAEEWTNKDVLYALLAYADAIDANRMDP